MRQIVRPGELEALPGPFEVKVTVRGSDTNGVMASIEETIQPKALISLHTHANDVWVYVLDGEIGVLVGDEVGTARAGEWALKPRDVPHAMWNATDNPARIVEVLTPAGSEEWFEQISGADAAAFQEACRVHGITFHPESPWNERLRDEFGVGQGAS